MTRVEKNKYSVLIRGDYLHELGKLRSNRVERDAIIQEAVEKFLGNYAPEVRERQIDAETPRMTFLHAPGQEPQVYMYFEIINFPDRLLERMEKANRDEVTGAPFYDDLGTVLNTAIRLYLESEGKLKPLNVGIH